MTDLFQKLQGDHYCEGCLCCWNDVMWEAKDEIARLRKDAKWMASKIDQLETALRSADCPGGGWTGQPKEIVVATVADCLKYDVCGCSFGDALKSAQ